MSRQVRRLEKAIDELIKIHDDGAGNGTTTNIIDMLRAEISDREAKGE